MSGETQQRVGAATPPFTVLLPVYRGDQAAFLERSLCSVTVEQTLRPDEVLIVRDGPVGEDLDDVLTRAEAGSDRDLTGGVAVRVLRLERNVGLARALEAGLREVRTEVVARQDADDVSLLQRFERQLPLMAQGYDLVGSALQEFSEDLETEPGAARDGVVRRQPAGEAEIRAVLGWRDPFNHPTVVFRRTAVRQAGGYQHLDLLEDYWLFARMVQGGCRAANLPEVLLLYRVGAGAYERRGGRRLLRSELQLQRRLRQIGVTSRAQYLRNVAVRGVYRLVPTAVRRAGYQAAQRLLARRGHQVADAEDSPSREDR